MRQLNKSEPDFFIDFIRDHNPENWTDIFPIRWRLRKHMLENEQNWQCAYTEVRINEGKEESHIDHFRKRTTNPELTFIYSNLFAASIAENYGAKYKDKLITKGDDYNDLLNPLIPNLSLQFKYDIDSGEIQHKTPQAKRTIEAFNLNHFTLLEMRKNTADIVISKMADNSLEDVITNIGEFESLIRYIYTVNNN